MTDGKGGYGYVIHLRAEDVNNAAEALVLAGSSSLRGAGNKTGSRRIAEYLLLVIIYELKSLLYFHKDVLRPQIGFCYGYHEVKMRYGRSVL